MAPKSKFAERLPLLEDFIHQRGRAPTLDDLRVLFDVHSKNTASVIAGQFVAAGLLTRTETGRLALPPRRTSTPLRILGSVAAGFPSPAEEALLNTLTLDEYLIEHPEATFLLKVEGDSMIEAGILPGDTVLVERGRTPRNGDTVIACVDGEWTLKHFFKDRSGIRLEPANAHYSTIRPKRSLAIEGVVCSVIRKLV
jgi:SOS regulatory protein LexA